ncbi:hypothetical protein AVEN_16068-1 [Araneus ventricosus]|uniref:Uncharacterized protein n=1 Tax=Araneus ventricosus TaxID=182803 RepID=A0A4Y2UWM4_ARAVE|nr:hypothetical protein AVEN_16068-1 [Araneus ventricosus]
MVVCCSGVVASLHSFPLQFNLLSGTLSKRASELVGEEVFQRECHRGILEFGQETSLLESSQFLVLFSVLFVPRKLRIPCTISQRQRESGPSKIAPEFYTKFS